MNHSIFFCRYWSATVCTRRQDHRFGRREGEVGRQQQKTAGYNWCECFKLPQSVLSVAMKATHHKYTCKYLQFVSHKASHCFCECTYVHVLMFKWERKVCQSNISSKYFCTTNIHSNLVLIKTQKHCVWNANIENLKHVNASVLCSFLCDSFPLPESRTAGSVLERTDGRTSPGNSIVSGEIILRMMTSFSTMTRHYISNHRRIMQLHGT